MSSVAGHRNPQDRNVAVPPGWYPIPTNPGETRWWDGQRWGPTPREAHDAGWWIANDGRYYPPGQRTRWEVAGEPPVASGGHKARPAPPSRRFYARWWFWVLVVPGALLAAWWLWVVIVMASIGPEDYEAVYEEDFSTGAGKFEIWEEPEGSAAVIDGAYVMTNRNTGRSLTVGVKAPWAAARARIDAQMELTEAANQDRFGLYLGRTDGERYVFSVSPSGEARITGPDLECQADSPLGTIRGGEIALSGQIGSPFEEATLEGSLDGRVIVTCVDEGLDSEDTAGFDGAGLSLFAAAEPATVRVDDVVVNSYMYRRWPAA
jgi:hypothetical protein